MGTQGRTGRLTALPGRRRVGVEVGTARASLNDLVSAVLLQAEAVEVLVRDLPDVAPCHSRPLAEAAQVLVDTAYALVAVRDRTARFVRWAA